jgi:hypothetical protein
METVELGFMVLSHLFVGGIGLCSGAILGFFLAVYGRVHSQEDGGNG